MLTAQEAAAIGPGPAPRDRELAHRYAAQITTHLVRAQARAGACELKCRVPPTLTPLVLEHLVAAGYTVVRLTRRGEATGQLILTWPERRPDSIRKAPQGTWVTREVDPTFPAPLLALLRRLRVLGPDGFVAVDPSPPPTSP